LPINITEKMIKAIPHSCLVKLQAVYDSLKTAEKKAADLLLERPKFFAGATIVEAAEQAGCSEATLVRLSRKLGFGGYPELKDALSCDKEEHPIGLYSNIKETDDNITIATKVFTASIQALSDTLNIIDKGEYEKAVDAIGGCNKILFYGSGDAATVAQSGYQKFVRAGFDVQASVDIDIQLISVSHMKKGDVFVAISHSGRTKNILDVVKYARAKGITVISITNFPVSPLAKNSDIILCTAAFAEHVNGEVISKRITELCILESLYVNVLIKHRSDLLKKIEISNFALEINKL